MELSKSEIRLLISAIQQTININAMPTRKHRKQSIKMAIESLRDFKNSVYDKLMAKDCVSDSEIAREVRLSDLSTSSDGRHYDACQPPT